MRKMTNEDFINKAILVHGDKYDYSMVDYKKSLENVIIICNKHGEFLQFPNNHLRKQGCPKCADIQRKETVFNRYGVNNVAKNENVKKKIEDTNVERYGTKCSIQNEEIKNKGKQTCLEKYGTNYFVESEDFKNIMVDKIHPMKIEKSKLQLKQTCLERYGVDSYSKTEDFKEKYKKTCLKNFGVENNKQRHFSNDIVKKLNDYDWLYDQYVNCKKNLHEIGVELGVDYGTVGSYLNKFGIEIKKFSQSSGEKEILKFVSQYEYVEPNDRKVIKPKELDIYIPNKNLAIEYCGIFWHSDYFNKNNNYHKEKYIACKEQNIQLITIFEDEWINKQEIVKSIIKNKLGIIDTKIYARNTVLKFVSVKDAKIFIETNHIQGFIGAERYYGLYYNDELVSILSVGKNRFKKNSYEIIRYCNKLNSLVVGGFGKILKAVKNDYNEVYSYCNLRFFDGGIYEQYGDFIKDTECNYFWIKPNNLQRIPRYKCQKHRLNKILNNFDINLTEDENMRTNGYYKLFDCGNKLYKL